MNDSVNNEKISTSFIVKLILLMLIPCILTRILYVLYSNAATDVTVRINSDIFLYSAQAMSCIFVGCSFAAIHYAIYRYSPKKALVPFAIYCIICLADRTARFFIDYFDGSIKYREKIAIVTLTAEFFAVIAIAFCVWIIGIVFHTFYVKKNGMRKYSEKIAVNAALILNFTIPFIRWIYNALSTAVEAEWILTVDETSAIIRDGITVVILYAIVAFIGSRISLAILGTNTAQ